MDNNNEETVNQVVDTHLQYWASKGTDELASELQSRIDEYYKYTMMSGLNEKWRAAYCCYYLNFLTNSKILSAGDVGQFSVIKVAEASNIIQHLINLTITDRPAWAPRAANSDVKSRRQVEFCKGLLDYYMREKRVEKDVYQAVEFAFTMGEGFVSLGWDSALGAVYSFDPGSGKPLNTGDLRYKVHEPIDVIRDTKLESFRNRDWIILREYENKYNLMAKFPEFAREIMNTTASVPAQQHYRFNGNWIFSTDQIPVYRFLHSKTPALTNGRITLMLGDGTVLSDGNLPYRHIPVSRVSPRDVIGQSHGHAPMFDLVPLNDNLNMLYSTILTNQETFGTQNILAPAGSNIDVEQLIGGLTLIEYNSAVGKPEPAELLQTPAEIFNTVNLLTTAAERISGVNSVTRGNAPTADSSGALAALLQQMAIEFSAPAQASYTELLEDLGTTTVQVLQDFANIPRIITIAGKANRSNTIEFKQADLSGVDRVLVDSANPMSKTTPGKMQIAQLLLQNKVITTPDELLSILNDGILEPMTEGKTMELLGLAAENESLMNGEQVPVILTDDHLLHIIEHAPMLADPEARKNPAVIQIVTAHINGHVGALSDPANAVLFHLLGRPVVPPQAAPAPPGVPQDPPAPQGSPAPPQAGGGAATVTGPAEQGASPGMVQHMQPQLPQGPINPLTKQRAPVNVGGGNA